jgi:ABC-2 type transport system ATP-binding protein
MEEAEYLCDQIAIINKGKIIALDTPAGLKQKYGNIQTIEIKIKNVDAVPALQLIKSFSPQNCHVESPETDIIRIRAVNAQEIMSFSVNEFPKIGIQILGIAVNPPTLEDA